MALGLKDHIKGGVRKAVSAAKTPSRDLKSPAENGGELKGPSPNPATNLVIADIALRTATTFLRRGVERGVLGTSYPKKKAKSIIKGRTMGETLLHTALARVALTSVPGAIIVGGGLIAKTLYDRNRAKKAHTEGAQTLQKMANDGAES